MQINHHFNFAKDVFSQEQMKDMKYDIGELKNDPSIANASFQFFQISRTLKKARTTLYYQITNGNVELIHNGSLFHVDKIFKKSSLEDYRIIIKNSSQLRIDCWILNSLLSLGAQLIVKDYKNLKTSPKERVYHLSLQHGVRIIESRLK